MFLHSLEPQVYLPTLTQPLGEDTSMRSVHFLWVSQESGKDHRTESWNSWSGKGLSKCNLVLPVHASTSPQFQKPWEYFHRSPEQGWDTCLSIPNVLCPDGREDFQAVTQKPGLNQAQEWGWQPSAAI